jgi:hypothetical protein
MELMNKDADSNALSGHQLTTATIVRGEFTLLHAFELFVEVRG